MDVYNAAIGLLLAILGILILVMQYRNGTFGKGEKITQNTVALTGGGIMGSSSVSIFY